MTDEYGHELTPEAQAARLAARTMSPRHKRSVLRRYQTKYQKLVGAILAGKIKRPIDWRWQKRYQRCRSRTDFLRARYTT